MSLLNGLGLTNDLFIPNDLFVFNGIEYSAIYRFMGESNHGWGKEYVALLDEVI